MSSPSDASVLAKNQRSSILKMPSRDLSQTHILNESPPNRQPLVVILGPTGVGKSKVALQLAERLQGEVVSADSRTFYRGMDIGTAKPPPADQARVPHHLIDVADPDEVWSLAVFQEHARRAIAAIHERGRIPFLVGGTGQYVRAVTEGWVIPRVAQDPHLRVSLAEWAEEIGREGLHDRLAVLDPVAAEKIDARNLRRTIRALEVILSSGRRFSEQRRSGPSPYNTLPLGLTRPRPELYARIDARIEEMLAKGFVDEVERLLARGYSPELPTLSAIGYREIIAYLRDQITLNEAVTRIQRATRTLVRRQANWFKPDDPAIQWFTVDDEVVDRMESAIQNWLST
jgi:tRNA dimethylallyltransferase